MASLTSIGIGTWNSREQVEHVPLSKFTLLFDSSGACSSFISGSSSTTGANCSGNSIPEVAGFEAG